MSKDQREIARKLRVLQHSDQTDHAARTCRYFGVGRSSFYRWREAHRKHGAAELINKPTIPKWHANRTPSEIEEKVLHLRSKYHLGPMRIVWYMARYHGIKISDATVSRTLKRNSVNRMPRGTRLRKVHTRRYNKQVPGHHIQMDVKFLMFKGERGEKNRRFQFTAIDNATRVRALKIYEKHTQASATDFVDHIIKTFPFRIREIRTDNGHEFQAKFHWHVEDQSIRHAGIMRGILRFERSTRGVWLTEAGRHFVEGIATGIDQLDHAAKAAGAFAHGDLGCLRVGVHALTPGSFLDGLLAEYRPIAELGQVRQRSIYSRGEPHKVFDRSGPELSHRCPELDPGPNRLSANTNVCG